jgi:hypothetical protein
MHDQTDTASIMFIGRFVKPLPGGLAGGIEAGKIVKTLS